MYFYLGKNAYSSLAYWYENACIVKGCVAAIGVVRFSGAVKKQPKNSEIHYFVSLGYLFIAEFTVLWIKSGEYCVFRA